MRPLFGVRFFFFVYFFRFVRPKSRPYACNRLCASCSCETTNCAVYHLRMQIFRSLLSSNAMKKDLSTILKLLSQSIFVSSEFQCSALHWWIIFIPLLLLPLLLLPLLPLPLSLMDAQRQTKKNDGMSTKKRKKKNSRKKAIWHSRENVAWIRQLNTEICKCRSSFSQYANRAHAEFRLTL